MKPSKPKYMAHQFTLPGIGSADSEGAELLDIMNRRREAYQQAASAKDAAMSRNAAKLQTEMLKLHRVCKDYMAFGGVAAFGDTHAGHLVYFKAYRPGESEGLQGNIRLFLDGKCSLCLNGQTHNYDSLRLPDIVEAIANQLYPVHNLQF